MVRCFHSSQQLGPCLPRPGWAHTQGKSCTRCTYLQFCPMLGGCSSAWTWLESGSAQGWSLLLLNPTDRLQGVQAASCPELGLLANSLLAPLHPHNRNSWRSLTLGPGEKDPQHYGAECALMVTQAFPPSKGKGWEPPSWPGDAAGINLSQPQTGGIDCHTMSGEG